MKVFKRLFIVFVIAVLIILFYLIFNGYVLYKDAIEEQSIDDRVLELRSSDFFSAYDELPQHYIDAVICVEDHKFYDHSGVDLLYIGRAIYNDLRAMKPLERRKHHYTASR